MREITTHKVDGVEDRLRIVALGEAGPGGACHEYSVTEFPPCADRLGYQQTICFQNGPVTSDGKLNGTTNEVLLAMVLDRLRGFQRGSYPCPENAQAMRSVQEAIGWLQARTRERARRGVEGTLNP